MTDQALVQFSDSQLELLRRHLAPEATDAELAFFGEVCQRVGLDPFRREIYAVHRYDRRLQGKRMIIQTGIDGYRKLASRTGRYEGTDGEAWCGEDGVWKDVWLSDNHPSAARVGVIRTGAAKPIYAVATWREHAQTNDKGELLGLWRTLPASMLAKCAEAKALRRAFPDDLAGVYVEDELGAQQHKPLSRRLFRGSPPPAIEAAQNPPAPVLRGIGAGGSETASPPSNGDAVHSGDHDAGAPPPPPETPAGSEGSGEAEAANDAALPWEDPEAPAEPEDIYAAVRRQLAAKNGQPGHLSEHQLARLRKICGDAKVRSSAKAIATAFGEEARDLAAFIDAPREPGEQGAIPA